MAVTSAPSSEGVDAQNPAYRPASHFFLADGPVHRPLFDLGAPAGGAAAYTGGLHESRRPYPLARPPLGAGRAAGMPEHARTVLDRHLPARLHRHRAVDRRHAGADEADPVGLPVR